MPRKGKRRREARRERKEHLRAAQEAPSAGPPPASPAKASEPPRRQPGRPWREDSRARKKRRGGGLPINPWLVAAPISVVAAVAIGVFLVVGAGGGSTATPTPSPTVDPRVAGMTPTATYTIEAGGGADNAFFAPNSVTVKAGEVFRIEVTNTGDVTHNLTISGLDKEYDTKDDWESVPYDIKPGQTGVVVAKFDSPGTYPFRCAFHPTVQFGNLIVQP